MTKTIQSVALLLLLSLHAQCQTTPVVVATTVSCATSTDGSVVGLLNPLNAPVVAAAYTGTLPGGNYYTEIGWYDAAGHVTLVSPEVQTQLTGSGALTVNVPTGGMPAAAVGMNVYIGSSSWAETLQGQTTGAATFTQSSALTSGTALPATNTTVCAIVANDAGWPTGTGYGVSMTTPAGDTMPGYPTQWQLLGPGSTINLGQGLPLYNGVVTYPVPLLARPYNHAGQSVSGPLSMTGYNLTQVGKIGVGTVVPAWPVDVENGAVNASGGYIYKGGIGVASGNCLVAGTDTYKTFAPGTCATLPTIYYQTVQNSNTSQPQELRLNFLSTLSVTDNSSNGSSDVGLPALGTAGTYTSPQNITLDAYGRVSSVVAGSAVSRTCVSAGCYVILTDGTIIQWGTAPSCGSTGGCTSAITFPHAFTTPPVVTCTLIWSPGNGSCTTGGATTTGVGINMVAFVVVGGSGGTFNGSESAPWFAIGN